MKLTLILLLSFIAIKSYLNSDGPVATKKTATDETMWDSVKKQWMDIKSLAAHSKEKLLEKHNEEEAASALTQEKSANHKKANEEEVTQEEKTIYYRWKDKKGQTHISGIPPKNISYDKVSVRKINTFSPTEEPQKESANTEENSAETTELSSEKFLMKLSTLIEQLKQTHAAVNQGNQSTQEKK